ncbi:hypothetical protein HY468_01075 [Candidatus Roizmanbacteria bacterium]|nr:hypothetical protein [Candidatus Roizmanbacteria bacterium]
MKNKELQQTALEVALGKLPKERFEFQNGTGMTEARMIVGYRNGENDPTHGIYTLREEISCQAGERLHRIIIIQETLQFPVRGVIMENGQIIQSAGIDPSLNEDELTQEAEILFTLFNSCNRYRHIKDE